MDRQGLMTGYNPDWRANRLRNKEARRYSLELKKRKNKKARKKRRAKNK